MTVGPAHVGPHIELARKSFKTEGKPRLAVVVSRDYDFGMARMLELTSAEDLPHEFGIFRSLDEACDWLGIDAEEVQWP